MKTTEFKVLPLEIGGVADFIWRSTRMRGIIFNITNGIAHMVVLGCHSTFSLPLDEITPVRDNSALIAACQHEK